MVCYWVVHNWYLIVTRLSFTSQNSQWCDKVYPMSYMSQNDRYSPKQVGSTPQSSMNNLILKVCIKAAHQVLSLPNSCLTALLTVKDQAKWFSPNVQQNCVWMITLCWFTIIAANRHSSSLSFPAPLWRNYSETVACCDER